MIRVVNKKNYAGSDGVYIGRPSPLGNPFTHLPGANRAETKVATREEAIERYRAWLPNAIETDEIVRQAFEHLVEFYKAFGELTLECWCTPKPCHGDVLREMIMERVGEKSD